MDSRRDYSKLLGVVPATAFTPFLRALALLVLGVRLGATAPSDWIVQSWYVADGLPNNNVAGLAQSADGHLWIAMPDCIARFDGVGFERFSPEALGADPRHRIRTLVHGRDDSLWVAADQDGVIRLRPGPTEAYAKAINYSVDSLVEDAEGAIWATYFGGDVRRFKDGSSQRFTELEGLPPRARCSLVRDGKGRIWFGKAGQVGLFRNDRFETLVHVAGSTPRLASASGGGVWVCSNFQLWKFTEACELQDCGSFQPAGARGDTNVVFEDSSGAVWLGTSSAGLIRYQTGRFQPVPVSDREITSLLEDHEGNLWVGTTGGGLNRVTPRAITLETTSDATPTESVQSICQDANGVFWAATSNGLLAQRTNDGWKTYNVDGARSIRAVTCIVGDTTGALWIGTAVGELHCLRDERLETFRVADGLVPRTVRSLLASSTGDLWLGGESPSSVQRLRNGKFTSLKLPPNTSHFRALAEDRKGTIWVAGQKGVLLHAADDQLIDDSAVLSGITSSIRSLFVTSDNSLWLGFGGHGVGRLRDGKFGTVRPAEGLYHSDISQIVADERGWLWFGCDRGLFKVRQAELDAVVENRAATVQSVVYGRSHGLPSLQAHFGDWPGAFRSQEGRLWIPMRSALVVVDPDKLRPDGEPLSVLLKRIAVDDETVAFYGASTPSNEGQPRRVLALQNTTADLRIAPGHHQVVFDFTAVSLGSPENVQFRYRLDGFDQHWNATRERAVRYPRLEAGNYRFRVIARNSEGVWNEKGADFAFTVTPFVWQRWWFRLASVGLFTLGIGAAVRYVSFRRLRRKLDALERSAALEKERARIARDIHDDVGNRLTEISLLSELALRDGETQKNGPYVQQISATVRHVTDSLDEIIWAVSPRNDTLPSVIHYIGEFAIEFLQTAQITCRMELPDRIPARHVTAEIRHNLFLAVKEALHNVVRHAHATEVVVRVVLTDANMSLFVRDNGRGFVSSEVAGRPGADGLQNMRQRMEEIHGSFSLRSAPGEGTEIAFAYAWPDDHGQN